MLNPDVTELLDDPELGGGESFTVIREERRRTLVAGASEQVTMTKLQATGNIQPAGEEALQLIPQEDQSDQMIVIYTKFIFQLGEDGYGEYKPADRVIYDNNLWKVMRVNHWTKWGFTIAYAVKQEGANLDGLE